MENLILANVFASAPVSNMGKPEVYLALIIGALVAVVMDVGLFFMLRRVFPRIFIVICELGLGACWLLNLGLGTISFAIALATGLVFFFIANQNESRDLVANNMLGKVSKGGSRKRKIAPEVLFDREAVYGEIRDAVLTMADQKTGAIITLEKKDSLSEFTHNGTMINAPVTSELLQTIFYKGTRLHDGAVIIRNNEILAAAVAYVPTTKPLTGKYGLRHRAAIGISEEVDAVTVVVSEETGRISIAYQGDLETVPPSLFLTRLEEYMSAKGPSKADEE